MFDCHRLLTSFLVLFRYVQGGSGLFGLFWVCSGLRLFVPVSICSGLFGSV